MKRSWVVFYNCHVLGAAEARKTVLVSQKLRALAGQGRGGRVERKGGPGGKGSQFSVISIESPFTERQEALMPPPRFVASSTPFLPPSGTTGVGDAGFSRIQLALVDTKAESEGIKCKLGPKQPPSGRKLEPEGRWRSVRPIPSHQSHKAIACPPSDF